MINKLLNKNIIFVLMLIIPLLLLLFCNYKTCALNQIEHFGVDDNSIKNIFNKLFGLNKTNIKNKNVVSELDDNINQLGNITNSIDTVNNNFSDNPKNNKKDNSKNISDSNNKKNDSETKVIDSTNTIPNLNIGFEDKEKSENKKDDKKKRGNENNRDINNIVETDIARDMSKAKPKEMPLLNKAGGLQQFGSNIIKGDFQQQSEKCKFFGGKCPNGYTKFGTFKVINSGILNGEKLVCDNSISKNNESCAYCCKQ